MLSAADVCCRCMRVLGAMGATEGPGRSTERAERKGEIGVSQEEGETWAECSGQLGG